ncbi:immunoglobulin lambda-1 light chain-like isoform X1 [Hemiscyllium ocellatum]|uniref:immunoglobulin lambda-1 light chain-like isoform X1 n=1 Tax=Hemiscyllium ocellatum TaxID=170820 RepID=UPI002966D56A|nr:immunoglobulin lambda-1 light chain-like isoform X1 [Hemiscyllium ocellatum]XP_060694224.1 immunoglobulin lambda-1 light chain-like isoform X1 [Hemiscyllium ocellatum]XP_060694225.1 immunoglobulin lambda-1 light chain-like isoform X1 [Hemiscyllium ocellatum]
MSRGTELRLILILVLSCTVTAEVKQFLSPPSATAGETVTFHCSFPLFRDIRNIAVHWWKAGDRKFLSSKQDSRRVFQIESKASAILRINNVRFGDAGVYYCRVQGEYTGNGTGTRLNVNASPHPLKITTKFSANYALTCICKTSGFYPKDHTIAWRKDGQNVVRGTKTSVEKNTEGLFEVTSYLVETQPARSGTVYVCEVSHSTLKNPTWVNYTVSIPGSSFSNYFPWWIYICIAIFSLLLIIIVLVICCKCCKRKAPKDNVRTRQCVRCSKPIPMNPKGKEQGLRKSNTPVPAVNPSAGPNINETPPKNKKHRKKERDPKCP